MTIEKRVVHFADAEVMLGLAPCGDEVDLTTGYRQYIGDGEDLMSDEILCPHCWADYNELPFPLTGDNLDEYNEQMRDWNNHSEAI